MGIVIIIAIIVIIVGLVIVNTKLGKLQERFSNHFKSKIGLDDSSVYGAVFEGSANARATKKLKKFHPEYNNIEQFAIDIVNGIINNTLPGQADKYQEKIRNDRRFQQHIRECSLRRVNIMSYNEKKDFFTACVTFSDKRDDYVFNISVAFTKDGLALQYATFQQGHANGF